MVVRLDVALFFSADESLGECGLRMAEAAGDFLLRAVAGNNVLYQTSGISLRCGSLAFSRVPIGYADTLRYVRPFVIALGLAGPAGPTC